MTRSLPGLLALAFALSTAGTAAAQEWQVARDQFAFAGRRLEIFVDVPTEGTLRLLRGEPGNVRVAGRAVSGFTAAGLTHDEQLTLSALTDGPVEYMVSVPEGVWVTVRLPDRALGESLGSHARGRTYRWGPAHQAAIGPGGATGAVAADEPTPVWVPPTDGDPFETRLYTTFTGRLPPVEIDVPDLRYIRSLTVRIEGDRFRVAASRPLAVDPGDPARMQIRPAGPPMDLVLVLPVTTGTFSLRAAGATAFRIADGQAATLCSPVTRQWLSEGRRWVTFTPEEGALDCGPAASLRHEG